MALWKLEVNVLSHGTGERCQVVLEQHHQWGGSMRVCTSTCISMHTWHPAPPSAPLTSPKGDPHSVITVQPFS